MTEVSAQLTDAQRGQIEERCKWAADNDVAGRIWGKDYTLWADEPNEITNRLGWLTIAARMLHEAGRLKVFAADAAAAGFTDCALLGMGGSSLAPEILASAFGTATGHLKLHVLDSTNPDAVEGLAGTLPLDTTLFLVSSKSGGTLETLSYYKFFRVRVADATHFAAITDPETSLAELAAREGFRETFLADPEIGGRYSALTHFGMVPAALAGIDIETLLNSGNAAADAARADSYDGGNGPLWLGLAIGELVSRGRDKLTFVVSEPLQDFGIWAEQLVAESSGKLDRGIVPIAGEPLGEPSEYGDDRIFAYVRNDDGADAGTDLKIDALAAAGHPVLVVPFRQPVDLGNQLFAWEFAVATACAVIGVNAFDQPNVQEAKDLTKATIDTYLEDGQLPELEPAAQAGPLTFYAETGASGSAGDLLKDLLGAAVPGAYFAVMGYLPYAAEIDAAATKLRCLVRDRLRVATTYGYGPRFLHSTGQLHKGGPASGVYLQIVDDSSEGVEIPGAGFDFGTLIAAQSLGDFQALQKHGRKALRVQIAGSSVEDAVHGLAQLTDLVSDVLK